ncbi:hypothetical protein QCA50_002990 [Cerrena zonata]|uniref:DAGKc domain-containing protein n=1 Tax=Cerrena zonata TaxID=2478898 RepID=A0AAW0GNG8_9APHY
MKAAYRGVKPKRNLLLLVNPHSGPGKARTILQKKIEPLFRAAHAKIDVIYTTHNKHATDIARDLELGKYDAIVSMSGDGLVYEILNGLAEHKNPIEALKTPITPIPTGSGNGLSLNLLGLKEGTDVSFAAVNAIKGKPMPIDLFSVTQDGKRSLSFFSQCIGLMAELDLWTEHLRFMGSNRFVYGYVRGVVKRKSCPIKLYIKVAESDKNAMFDKFKEAREAAFSRSSSRAALNGNGNGNGHAEPNGDAGTAELSTALPPLKYKDEDPTKDEGWILFDKPVSYFYAGQGPFVSVDLMQFPVSLPNDGHIDIAVQAITPRGEMLSAMDGAEKGRAYWKDSCYYYKAKAYRIEPQSSASCLSIDGEKYPFKPYDLEVHPGLGTLLSLHGTYNTDFDPAT